MPRKMAPANEKEYEMLKRFLIGGWEYACSKSSVLSILDKDADPIEQLENMEKTRNKSQVLSGLKQAVNDILIWFQDLSPEDRKELNLILKSHNAPSLQEMSVKYKKTLKKVFERGKISTEEEYYIVMEFLNDVDSELTKSEREVANEFISQFESSIN